jgi:hypothetical protein
MEMVQPKRLTSRIRRYRRKGTSLIILQWLVVLVSICAWNTQKYYELRQAQFNETTAFTSLFYTISDDFILRLHLAMKNSLDEYYQSEFAEIPPAISEKSMLSRDQFDKVFVHYVVNKRMNKDHITWDDLNYLWDMQRIVIPVLVLPFSELQELLKATPKENGYQIQDWVLDEARFNLKLVLTDGTNQKILSLKLESKPVSIEDVNLLRLMIDEQYRSLDLVRDVTANFEDNFPNAGILPPEYRGLLLEEMVYRLERELDNPFVNYAPRNDYLLILIAGFIVFLNFFTHFPERKLNSKYCSSRSWCAFLASMLPTAVAVYFVIISLKLPLNYGELKIVLLIAIAVCMLISGIMLSNKISRLYE